MKKLILLMALALCVQTYAQRKPKIKGNKSVVEVQEVLPPFNAIELNDDLDIVLQKSRQSGYGLVADDNLIDVLKFKVEDSTLVISSYYKITGKKKLEITVNYEELQSVLLRDGRMESQDNITAEVFNIDLFESAKLQLNVNAGLINLNMEGNSSGDLNLQADSLSINLKDRIDVGIYAVSGGSTIEMQKNATAKLEGTTDTLTVNLFESSNLKAQKFEAISVMATLQDSSDANIYAREEFELSARGSSRTHLYGDPTITLTDFLDTSELHKEN